MSHRATTWAMSQTGLRPAEKLLLLCLADRHNPDMGCFPNQETLARDACMSRAAVNENLNRLEAAGLIRRVQRLDERTKRQKSTRYILGFEIEDPQEPCPETGHGTPGPETGTEAERAAEPCPESGRGPCPDSAPSRVRNLDTNLVREPVIFNPPLPPGGAAAPNVAAKAPRRRRGQPQTGSLEGVVAILRRKWGMADAGTLH